MDERYEDGRDPLTGGPRARLELRRLDVRAVANSLRAAREAGDTGCDLGFPEDDPEMERPSD